MKIQPVKTGFLKLDGGAMFGIVPKQLWKRLNPPDDDNLCTWALRCLLVEIGDRKILIDTGVGDKHDEKFRAHFQPHGDDTLMGSLSDYGLAPEEITDVFLTHLHFDHVGGAVSKDGKGNLYPTFPNADYWTNELHYRWAMSPNAREKASFLKENFVPLEKAGQLKFLDVQKDDLEWLPGFKVRYLYGHTEAMMMPMLEQDGQQFIYCADLMPSSGHIGMPYVMAYDVRPLDTLAEKERLLEEALAADATLLFEHDPKIGQTKLRRNDRGRIVAAK